MFIVGGVKVYKVYVKEYEVVSIVFHKEMGVIAVGDSEMVIEHYLKLVHSLSDSDSCNELYLMTLPNSNYTQHVIDMSLSDDEYIFKFSDYVKYNPNINEIDLNAIVECDMCA